MSIKPPGRVAFLMGGEEIRLHFCLWQKLRFCSVKPSQATVHWTVALDHSNLLCVNAVPIKKTTQEGGFLIGGLEEVRLHFCLWQKLRFCSVKPSQATVHWTVALNHSNLLCVNAVPIKKATREGGFLIGGLEEIRTPDPHNANVVRSQLRYKPICPDYTAVNRLCQEKPVARAEKICYNPS